MTRFEIVNIVCSAVNAGCWGCLALRLMVHARLMRQNIESSRHLEAATIKHTAAIREFLHTIKNSPYFHEQGPTPPTVQ